MAGSVKGIIVEIGGDTSGLQKALSKVNSATYSLSKELRGVNSLLKLDPKNTELLGQKQKLLNDEIAVTSKKLEELKIHQEEIKNSGETLNKDQLKNYRNLQREIINTENKLKDLQVQASKWNTAGEKLTEFGNKVTNISNKLDGLGSTLTTTLTLPVLAIGTAAVTTGNDFEAQMSRVQAIAGATKDELQQLTDQAMQLGAETSFSASEVAEGMENLASAGFTTKEIMEAMPGLLDLAASSGADLATASEIAASAIRGFGLEANSSAHVADVFAEAAARTNAQTEDMGEAMKYIAPIANTMGLKIEEVAAAIGIMSDAGIKGSQAGTSLRGALVRLTKPTDKMLGIMEDLGISFYDNEGKMKSLTEMISMLQEATKGLTDEQKQNALTILFGTESLSGMMSLINRGSGELADMTKSFENCNGAAQEMADTMLDNTKGAFESLSGSLETAEIAIQQALAPSIKGLAEWIQGLVDDFNELSDEEKENVLRTVALVAAIGPAIKILSKFGSGIGTVTKGIGTFTKAVALTGKTTTTAFKEASSATQNLSKAFTFLKSSVGIATTAITAVTLAIAVLKTKIDAEMKSIREEREEIESSIQTRQSSLESINQELSANMSQIENTKQLRTELSNLVDENGRVKEGYETRVQFILNELNSALGTEYKLNGNLINSYEELKGSIDEVIQKKQAQLILEANEEKYKEAINNKDQAMQDLLSTQDQIAEVQQKINDLEDDWSWRGTADMIMRKKEYQDELESLNTNASNLEGQIRDYYSAIDVYGQNSELMIKGGVENLKKIEESVAQTQANITNNSNESLKQRIENQIKANEQSKRLYEIDAQYNKDAKSSVYATNVQEGEKNLQLLAEELVSRTNTIGELGPAEIEAWKLLANGSHDVYSEAIRNMPEEMQTKIEEITGVVASDTTVKDATEKLAGEVDSGFNDNVDGTKWGNDFVQETADALKSKTSFKLISGAAATVAGWISDYLHHTTPDKGPMKNDDEWMPDLIKSMAQGIYTNKGKLLGATNDLAEDLQKSLMLDKALTIQDLEQKQGNLISKAVDSTKMIYTTPHIVFNVQELDKQKLEQCFDYINKKFGSKY